MPDPAPLTVVTPYGRDGASSRVRVLGWLDRLSEPAEVHAYLGTRDLSAGTIARHPGRVVTGELALRRLATHKGGSLLLHREASPLSAGGLEESLLRNAALGIYDIDDALQWDWGMGRRLRRILPKAPKTLRTARAADRIIAGNPLLADWATSWAPDVRVIPSCVEPDLYTTKSSYEVHDPPLIGWIGSANTEKYLRDLEAPLFRLHHRLGARLVVLGSVPGHLGRLEQMVDRMAWSEQAARSETHRWDVGIMPLPDRLYERGKCGYKLLQYGAAGVPPVGSPVGMNVQILTAMGAAAPTGPDHWYSALAELIEGPREGRERLGRQAREVVDTQFSFSSWESEWRSAVGLPQWAGART